jgi:hypothetical protein
MLRPWIVGLAAPPAFVDAHCHTVMDPDFDIDDSWFPQESRNSPRTDLAGSRSTVSRIGKRPCTIDHSSARGALHCNDRIHTAFRRGDARHAAGHSPGAMAEPAATVRRRTTVDGPGGATVRHSTTVHTGPGVGRGAVVVAPRPVVVAPGRWVRPYRWAPGGAIAAGATIGFVAAASATAYYSSPPPQPGMCWYCTDPSKRNGFWDVCP